MFKTPIQNATQKRTIRPQYAQHQATAWAGWLDPAWDRKFDVLPGMVMCRKGPGEVFAPFESVAASGKGFGLAALFLAPKMQIDEVTPTGTNAFTVWVGNNNAAFEILAPAFDQTATWTEPGPGRVLLFPSLVAGQIGKLTPTKGAGMDDTDAVAELLDVIDANTILVSLNRQK
ncbi:structural protein [Rhodococcus phage E3]|uniref:structural protein n=1 Tax=Rhodococcus phage E3 TaxID=1007869 RepID=UPI0002C6A606|nr:structural protein [Rhodococcus phage E3]AEQ20991.1 structural protein [Rhodococcus phage E3]